MNETTGFVTDTERNLYKQCKRQSMIIKVLGYLLLFSLIANIGLYLLLGSEKSLVTEIGKGKDYYKSFNEHLRGHR